MKIHTHCVNNKLRILCEYWKLIYVIILSALLLIGSYFMFQNYYRNSLKILDEHYFYNAENSSEALVIPARLVDYDNGLIPVWHKLYWDNKLLTSIRRESPYWPQVGFSGIYSGIVYKYFTPKKIPTEQRIEYTRMVLVLSNIFFLMVLLLWLYHEFGFITAMSTYIVLLYSPWLVAFIRNFYWVPCTLLLPFAVCVFFFWNHDRLEGKKVIISACFSLYLAMLIRFSCGFEFASCVFFSSFIPLTYYAVKFQWGWIRYLAHILISSLIGIAAFFSTLCINTLQTMLIGKFTFSEALYFVQNSMFRRTGYGDISQVTHVDASLLTSLDSVFATYFFTGRPVVFNWHFIVVVSIFASAFLFSVMIWVDRNGHFIRTENRKSIALFAAGAVSLCSPLSWLILAKGHSYVHSFIVFFIFSLPAVPLMLAAPVSIIETIIKNSIADFRKNLPALLIFSCASVFCIVSWWLWQYSSYSGYIVLANAIVKNPDFKHNEIYGKFFDNKLWLVTRKRKKSLDDTRFKLSLYSRILDQNNVHCFRWDDTEIRLPFFIDSRLIVLDFPPLFSSMEISQFRINPKNNAKLPLWKIRKEQKPLLIYPLTDVNWKNGIRRHQRNIFLMKGNFPDLQATMMGKLVLLPSKQIGRISKFIKAGEFSHVYFNRANSLPPLKVLDINDENWDHGIYRADRKWILIRRADNQEWQFMFSEEMKNLSFIIPGCGTYKINDLLFKPGYIHISLDREIKNFPAERVLQYSAEVNQTKKVPPTTPANCNFFKSNYYLTDSNWVNGYFRRSGGFFVPPTPANIAKFRVGRSVLLPDGSVRKIISIAKRPYYLNVYTEGKPFFPAVKPHELAVK